VSAFFPLEPLATGGEEGGGDGRLGNLIDQMDAASEILVRCDLAVARHPHT
jgi:hypothetical protein